MAAETTTSVKTVSELENETLQDILMLREALAERDDMPQGMTPKDKHGGIRIMWGQ